MATSADPERLLEWEEACGQREIELWVKLSLN